MAVAAIIVPELAELQPARYRGGPKHLDGFSGFLSGVSAGGWLSTGPRVHSRLSWRSAICWNLYQWVTCKSYRMANAKGKLGLRTFYDKTSDRYADPPWLDLKSCLDCMRATTRNHVFPPLVAS
jgi:hypothetical protein